MATVCRTASCQSDKLVSARPRFVVAHLGALHGSSCASSGVVTPLGEEIIYMSFPEGSVASLASLISVTIILSFSFVLQMTPIYMFVRPRWVNRFQATDVTNVDAQACHGLFGYSQELKH
eukprot:6280623-Amphidinium_carterae.2